MRIIVEAGQAFRGIVHYEDTTYDVSSNLGRDAVERGVARWDWRWFFEKKVHEIASYYGSRDRLSNAEMAMALRRVADEIEGE